MAKIFSFLLLLFSVFVFSQNADFIEVQKKLDEASTLYEQSKYEKAIAVLDALYKKSKQQNNPFGMGMALQKKTFYKIESETQTSEPDWNSLEAYKTKNTTQNTVLKMHLLKVKAKFHKNTPQAAQYLEEAMKIPANSPEELQLLGEIYLQYGGLKHKNTDNVEANKYFLKAQQIFEKSGNTDAATLIYGELSNSAFMMKEYDRAIDYAEKGIESRKKFKDYENLCIQLSNLARIHQHLGKPELAEKYFLESSQYAEKSSKKETKFVNLVDISLLYHSKKDRENALKYMEKALEEGRKINQPKLHRYIRTAAMFAGYTGNEDLMNQYYDESYALAMKDQDKDALRDWNASQNFYYANVKKDPAKAYPFLEKFHAYKDSLLNEKSKKDFNELEIQYQTEKKQHEINQLSAEKKIQNLEIQRKNALLKGNLLEAKEKENEILLLTKNKELGDLKILQQAETLNLNQVQIKFLEQQKTLAAKENELKENKIQNEKLVRNLIIATFIAILCALAFLINRMILKKKIDQKNMLLSERNRISSELHDEVGSTLTAINLLSHSVIKNLKNSSEPIQKQVEKIRDNTQNVMENISDIVWSMNPENDGFQEIKIRMMEFIESALETAGIEYTFGAESDLTEIKMNAEKRRDFYLIFKEAVNNLAKYSKATEAKINIKKKQNFLELFIEDNGIGFNETTVKKGNGLNNMKKRAQRNKGFLRINSTENGTAIHLSFPYAS